MLNPILIAMEIDYCLENVERYTGNSNLSVSSLAFYYSDITLVDNSLRPRLLALLISRNDLSSKKVVTQ